MTQRVVAFLGASSDQAPSYRAARDLGFHVIGIDGNPKAFAFRFADETHNISVRDHQAIQRALQGRRVDGFYSQASDSARLAEFHLTEAFDAKKKVSIESVKASSDKAFFVKALESAGLPHQRQVAGSSAEALRAQVAEWSLPFVVKPNDSSGSKGVRSIEALDELDAAFHAAKRFSLSEVVLCEELVRGQHYSVDAFIRGRRPEFMTVSRKVMTALPLLIPLHYVMPAGVPAELEARLEASVSRICDALRIAAGPITCDVVVKDSGEIYFIEMGARAGGNAIGLMMERAYAPNFVKASVGLAAGLDIPVRARRRRHAALITLASRMAGRFQSVKGLDRLASENLISEHEVFYEKEEPIEALTDGSNKLGYVILEADTAADLLCRFRDVRRGLQIEVKTGDGILDLDLL